MQQFSFTPEKIKQWPAILWVITVVLLVLVLGITGYMVTMYVYAGVIFYYIGWGLFIVLSFVVISCIFKKSYYFHMHHYTIGMVFIALIGYQSVVAALIQGFCNGMMIEGGCRWGYDPIWNKRKPSVQ